MKVSHVDRTSTDRMPTATLIAGLAEDEVQRFKPLPDAARRQSLSSATTAAKRAQYSQPGRCRAISATSVSEASPSSTTDNVRRTRRHGPLSITLN
jgi:hypothetical protein